MFFILFDYLKNKGYNIFRKEITVSLVEAIFMNYYPFIYLDDDMINSLYSQMFGDIIEKNISHNNSDEATLSINSNLFNILGATINNKDEYSLLETTKIVISTARKAQIIINYFRKQTIPPIQSIIKNNLPINEGQLFVGKSTFFLSDIVDKNTGASLLNNNMNSQYKNIVINDSSLYVLESGNTYFIHKHCTDYMNTDDYYRLNLTKNDKYGLMMHMSNSKIKKDIRHLTWAIERAKSFNFFVFGELIKSSEQFYKISPFAIWQ